MVCWLRASSAICCTVWVQCCLIWKRTHQFSSLTGLNLTAVDVRRLVRVTALLDELVLQITIDATEPCDLSLLLQRLNLGLELLGLRSSDASVSLSLGCSGFCNACLLVSDRFEQTGVIRYW